MTKKFIQLSPKDLSKLKSELHKNQNDTCPLLGVKFKLEDMVVDHKHKKKSDPCGPNGDGLVRGAINRFANALEGKITNNWKRMGLDKHIDLPTYLRNLADYLENPPCEQVYIHPSEKPKRPKLKKSCYNKLKKEYSGRAKFPEYPKNGYLTKKLEKLFEQYQIEVEYYS